MTSLLDTSVVVRYLTGEPRDLAELSAALIDTREPFAVTGAVIAEAAYVLRSVYRVEREAIVDKLVDFLARGNLTVQEIPKDLVLEALLFSRPSGRVSIVDGLTWAAAHDSNVEYVYTFDRRFPRDRIEVRVPGRDPT
jgi:predicted nucleic acid-binding protein